MDPEDIKRKAEAERQKQNKIARKNSANKSFAYDRKHFQPSSANSWRVYNRIYPYYYNVFIWFFIVATLGFVCLVIYYIETRSVYMLYAGLAFLGAVALRILMHWALKIIRFSSYKNWRGTLGFQVHGWDKLGTIENFPNEKYWFPTVEVNVIANPNMTQEQADTVHAAMYLLTVEANRCFYAMETHHHDSRARWSAGDLNAFGSANASVMGDIYKCINIHLRIIHNKYNCIKQVNISYSGELRKIEAMEVSVD